MEIIRNDDDFFESFGQVYITTVFPNIVKAWHKHLYQDDNICCIKGNIKLVVSDEKEFKEYFIGDKNPLLVHILMGIWHGFMGLGDEVAYIINIPTKEYNYSKPDELRKPFDGLNYNWEIKNE